MQINETGFGARVLEWRREAGIGRTALARTLGVSVSTVQSWEDSESPRIHAASALRLARILSAATQTAITVEALVDPDGLL